MEFQRGQAEYFTVGEWLVKPAVDRIERSGQSVTLEPRAMDILVYLAQRPREVISIDRLVEDVWAGQIVSDNTVYQWIRILRKALADGPDAPAYIETITKKGYRLIAEVGLPTRGKAVEAGGRRGRLATALAAVTVLAILVFYYAQQRSGLPEFGNEIVAAALPDRPSVAVLPFANHSGNESGLRFAEGMHDEVLTTLAKVKRLKVISRTSVMSYRDSDKDLPTISRELGVDTVLEGGVQHVGDRLRINVQLIDARTDEHLWAETFNREATASNVFAIQTEIARAVADIFEIEVSPEIQSRFASLPTENYAAWEAYLRGRQALARSTIDSLLEAVDSFRTATQLDPQFAPAFVGLADAYAMLDWYEEYPHDESLKEKARTAVDRALELDEDSSEAYAIFGFLLEGELAEAALERSIELNPNNAEAYYRYALALQELGEYQASLAQFEKARELDPLSSMINLGMGMALEQLGHFEEAHQQYARILEIDPHFREIRVQFAALESLVHGRIDRALEILMNEASLLDQTDEANAYYLDLLYSNIVISYMQLGDYRRAEELIERFEPLLASPIGMNYARVKLQIVRGEWPEGREYPVELEALDEVLDGRMLGDAISVQWLYRMYDLRAGRHQRALDRYRRNFPELLEITPPPVTPENLFAAIDLVPVLKGAGEEQRANQLIAGALETIETLPRQGRFGFGIADAMVYALQGRKADALQSLNEAIVDSHWRDGAMFYLEFEPNLFSLHDEPGYQALAAIVEADMREQLAGVREMERVGDLAQLPQASALSDL